MIITCPNCSTQFEIPDSAYRPGRMARCSQCGFVFPLPERDGPGPEADAAATNAEAGDTEAFDPAPASVDDAVFEPEEKAAPARGARLKGKVFLAVAALLAVCILVAGGFLLVRMLSGSSGNGSPEIASDSSLKSVLGGDRQPTPEEKAREEARQATVRNLALLDVRQYTVTENTAVGRMVVVEGKVVNNFDKPKDLILLEITLFDKNGRPLVIREQYCGVTLSLLQLRTLSKSAIEAALGNQTVILSNNTDIPPGGQVPFVTVFFNLPAQAYEFEVKIADVKDAAPLPAEK